MYINRAVKRAGTPDGRNIKRALSYRMNNSIVTRVLWLLSLEAIGNVYDG